MTDSLVTCDKLGEVELGIVQSVCLIGERGCLLYVLRESTTVMEWGDPTILSPFLWLSAHERFRRVKHISQSSFGETEASPPSSPS